MASEVNNSKNIGDWKFSLEIPLLSEKHAIIAYNSLRIDKELRKSEVLRQIFTEGKVLKMLVLFCLYFWFVQHVNMNIYLF